MFHSEEGLRIVAPGEDVLSQRAVLPCQNLQWSLTICQKTFGSP